MRYRQFPVLWVLRVVLLLCVGSLSSCATVPADADKEPSVDPLSVQQGELSVVPEPVIPSPGTPPVVAPQHEDISVKKLPVAPVPQKTVKPGLKKKNPASVKPVPVPSPKPSTEPVVQAPVFTLADVVQKAREQALQPYTAPQIGPQILNSMTFRQWQSVVFKNECSLWRTEGTPFTAQFYHPGSLYSMPVRIHVVDGKKVEQLPFSSEMFSVNDLGLAVELAKVPLDFAGFSISSDEGSRFGRQLVSFLGATYFRGAVKGGHYGTSALGLAVNSGGADISEYPRFTDFWLVKPAPRTKKMTLYAVMDSPSMTGAYAFVIAPGKRTVMDVRCVLFARNGAQPVQFGVAPLSCMYFSDGPEEAHDADVLLFEKKNGRQVVTPLSNPKRLATTHFELENPSGFGLMQRERRAERYKRVAAPYELRPSVWVETRGQWGKGKLELVEIPTGSPVNNNIILSWVPDTPRVFSPDTAMSDEVSYAYRLSWLNSGDSLHDFGRVEKTDVKINDDQTVTFEVYFSGKTLNAIPADLGVSSPVICPEGVTLLQKSLSKDTKTGGWTLTFDVRLPKAEGMLKSFLPSHGEQLPLRFQALLQKGDNIPEPLTEVWIFDLRR